MKAPDEAVLSMFNKAVGETGSDLGTGKLRETANAALDALRAAQKD